MKNENNKRNLIDRDFFGTAYDDDTERYHEEDDLEDDDFEEE